jgi:hypothetical protein
VELLHACRYVPVHATQVVADLVPVVALELVPPATHAAAALAEPLTADAARRGELQIAELF